MNTNHKKKSRKVAAPGQALGALHLSVRDLAGLEVRCFQAHEVPTVFLLPVPVLVQA